MRLTVAFDYPDALIEKHGERDAADTIVARLDELWAGPRGADLFVPDRVEVVIGEMPNVRVYTYGDGS